MTEKMIAWMHDDITWCTHSDCPRINCMRNPINMMDRTGLHSYADFRECDECSIYRGEKYMEGEGK